MTKAHKVRGQCMVCARTYNTGAVLLYDGKHPKQKPEWGLCVTHTRLRNRNLIALVEVDPAKSRRVGDTIMQLEGAHRTGVVVYVANSLFTQFFKGEPPTNGVSFVAPEVIASLQKMKLRLGGKDNPH